MRSPTFPDKGAGAVPALNELNKRGKGEFLFMFTPAGPDATISLGDWKHFFLSINRAQTSAETAHNKLRLAKSFGMLSFLWEI
jgi:hypothetical protein